MKSLLLVLIIFSFCNCQKQEIDCCDAKKIFNLLPPPEDYNNQGNYKLLIDTINSDPPAYYHISGKLFFQQTMIWQADSSYVIKVTGNDSLILVQNTIAAIGSFTSNLFYNDEDITEKATPNGFPRIAEIRFGNNSLYLSYGGYNTFRKHKKNLYASYNLLTGELQIN